LKIVVTGAAGFIGSNLVDALLNAGHEVRGIDNFVTGVRAFLTEAETSSRFELHQLDLIEDVAAVRAAISGSDVVVHLAANADVRFGWNHPARDLEQNVLATQHILEAVRTGGVPRLLFSSTGSVYGETEVIPTPENCPFPVQTSLYGASKLAAEGLVAAYAEGAGISATVFRFVSIMGPRYTHGHVVDFLRQLQKDPAHLVVLGDGSQRKSYLHVEDCVRAILARLGETPGFEVFNLGVDDYCTVRDSVGWICARAGVEPELSFTGGERGWVGDNPFIYLDITKICSTGWKPRYSIREAVEDTVDYLLTNPSVLERDEPAR
jgi:UDP-glucose 4-epimerase